MTRDEMTVLMGQLLDDSLELAFEEFCEACHANESFVIELVAEGVIEPRGTGEMIDLRGGERTHWRFSGRSLHRAQVARRLHEDLDVNLPGIALALDLLEEIEALQRRLHGL
jgi:chaperone modulatory protein CbpM